MPDHSKPSPRGITIPTTHRVTTIPIYYDPYYHAAIDMLLYVYATRNLSLYFPGSVKTPLGVDPKLHASIETSKGLIAYSDSSWRKPNELGFNMFGYVVCYCGAPVSYVAKHLKVVALRCSLVCM